MKWRFKYSPAENLYDSKTVSDINIVPSSHEFIDIQGLEFETGRFYNESEANSGSSVIPRK
jgi:putative ABC transport system permease protein